MSERLEAERPAAGTSLPDDFAEKWFCRAKGLLEDALARIDDEDVLQQVTEAEMCLRIAFGEADPAELEDGEAVCICPPALVARGGFRGGCPVHGSFVISPQT